MRGLFLMVLSMSGTASLVILLVLLLRMFLRKAPRVFSYALWAAVLFRLLCPITFESPVGIIPSGMPVLLERRLEVTDRLRVADHLGAPDSSGAANISSDPDTLVVAEQAADTGGITDSLEGRAAQSATSPAGLLAIATAVWLCGATGLLLYSLISLLQLQRRLLGATPLAGERQVWLADHISSPLCAGTVPAQNLFALEPSQRRAGVHPVS